MTAETPALPSRGLRLWPLVMTIFFLVSGGPFGLEPVMQSGAGMGLLLILITPFIWSLPSALLTAELGSAMPEQGGYYVWVKRAMGPFAGFLCAWFTFLYSWVDMAMYPCLFIHYLRAFPFADFLVNPYYSFIATLCMVLPLTMLNVRGSKLVGGLSIIMGIVLMLPFFVMILVGIPEVIKHFPALVHPFVPKGKTAANSFTLGLFVVMWNYLGWDNISTVAGEIDNPKKAFPKALFIVMPIVIITYLLPAIVGIQAQPDTSKWVEGSWPAIAAIIGGHTLGNCIALCGLVSVVGLFSAGLMYSSRIPFVLANDKLLPAFFTRLHPRFGTPLIAIVISALIYTLLSTIDFGRLAEMNVLLYSIALVMEFAALMVLRKKEPAMPRPYKIPGGWPVLWLVVTCPVAIISVAFYKVMYENSVLPLTLIGFALFTALVIWMIRSRKLRKPVN